MCKSLPQQKEVQRLVSIFKRAIAADLCLIENSAQKC